MRSLGHSVAHHCLGILIFWRETHGTLHKYSSTLFLGFGTLVIDAREDVRLAVSLRGCE